MGREPPSALRGEGLFSAVSHSEAVVPLAARSCPTGDPDALGKPRAENSG
jgi:hypothetical protein